MDEEMEIEGSEMPEDAGRGFFKRSLQVASKRFRRILSVFLRQVVDSGDRFRQVRQRRLVHTSAALARLSLPPNGKTTRHISRTSSR